MFRDVAPHSTQFDFEVVAAGASGDRLHGG